MSFLLKFVPAAVTNVRKMIIEIQIVVLVVNSDMCLRAGYMRGERYRPNAVLLEVRIFYGMLAVIVI